MEEKDLQQIGNLIEEKVPRIINERVNPRFDQMREDFAKVIEENINPQFDEVNNRLGKIEATMVTKSYLDDKLADLKGDYVSKFRQEEAKDDYLTNVLENKKILDKKNLEDLEELRVFPKINTQT